MPPSDQNKTIPPLTAHEKDLAADLKSDVFFLANEIGERNLHRPGTMEQTASWIQGRLREMGYRPENHHYRIESGRYRGTESTNIIAEVKGKNSPDEIIIIGAHYDSVIHSPGANDNASAVAALLALANWFEDKPQDRTIRFLFFANEEPPFFHTPEMGSYAYAKTVTEMDEHITSMIALDGLGYFSDEPKSQQYPVPGSGLMYPNQANFIGFVTKLSNRNLLNKTIKAFRAEASVSAEGAALPGFIPGVYWSDHWSFWQHDIDALLVTDTLLFRDPHYHSANDTPERLDYEMMARVTAGLKSVTKLLASEN